MTAWMGVTCLAALFMLTAGATPAIAEERRIAQAAPVTSEFRGSTRGRQGYVDHIWKLQPDRTITGRSTERRGGGQGGYSIDLSDRGRWQMRQQLLCIEWSGSFAPLNGCCGITRQQGVHVRLDGPAAFEGTLDPPPSQP